MKAASSGKNSTTLISRLAITSIAGALTLIVLGFAATPARSAEIPPDQIKAAGAIPLTKDLFDKMEKVIKAIDADAAAKTELSTVSKDPTMTTDNWGSTVMAKGPKTTEIFKTVGITPDDFGKALFAIMAVAMSEELAKSEDKAVKANADFVAANKVQADTIFGSFMKLSETSSSSPASTP